MKAVVNFQPYTHSGDIMNNTDLPKVSMSCTYVLNDITKFLNLFELETSVLIEKLDTACPIYVIIFPNCNTSLV